MADITYTSKGQGALNTVLGAIGTAGATGILGNLGGIFGNNCGGCGNMRNGCGGNCGNHYGYCSEDHYVDRYDAAKDARIAQLETDVKFRDSTIYTDGKSLELYKYIDGQLTDIRNALCDQRVHNQRTEDSFALAQADLKAVKQDLECKINREAERRCCNDSAIVNYVNATFYPKMAADVTVGTTTTAQTLYNPIANCGKSCDCGC
jgi:hypothetical protein